MFAAIALTGSFIIAQLFIALSYTLDKDQDIR